MKELVAVCIVGLFGFSVNSYACSFNTDCEVGARCVKQGFELEGVCVGGYGKQGNAGDRDPVRDPLNKNRGKSCSFDTDCDVGRSCVKTGFNVNGVCM